MKSGLLEWTAGLVPAVRIYASMPPPGCSELFVQGQGSLLSRCRAAWMRGCDSESFTQTTLKQDVLPLSSSDPVSDRVVVIRGVITDSKPTAIQLQSTRNVVFSAFPKSSHEL
jgi:hypothetical protein